MRAVRCVLQVGTFVFFAAWFLCLVAGRPFNLPQMPTWPATRPLADTHVKPSPIEMLKQVNKGHQ